MTLGVASFILSVANFTSAVASLFSFLSLILTSAVFVFCRKLPLKTAKTTGKIMADIPKSVKRNFNFPLIHLVIPVPEILHLRLVFSSSYFVIPEPENKT